MPVIEAHVPGYQVRDHEVIDYQMFPLRGTNLWFRGPCPSKLVQGRYFTSIGAAQTLGCFCEAPFPALLQNQILLPALNLGYGGAGPYFFLQNRALLDYINRGRFVIVQVMSGRSESNSCFDSGGLEYLTRRSDGARIGAEAAYRELLEGSDRWRTLPGQRYWRWLNRKFRQTTVKTIISETRQNWISSYLELLNQIKVPKVLLWFSTRAPDYQERYSHVGGLFNKFPQLVNRPMVEDIQKACDFYVECVTSRGSPQPLRSRFTSQPTTVDPSRDRQDLGGQLWTHNAYYPSPEMHEDAAAALHSICQSLLYPR